MIYALALTPEGNLLAQGSRELTLEDMQKVVGGYVELIPLHQPLQNRMMTCFANEDGHRLRLAGNKIASRLTGHVIVGNLLIMGPQKGENVLPLTDRTVETLTAFVAEQREQL